MIPRALHTQKPVLHSKPLLKALLAKGVTIGTTDNESLTQIGIFKFSEMLYFG